ncbi:MAG: hypothetical protein JRE72_17040 [Deltaproteobacteria bacterium]|jgi:peroxiredoxin|nr:hypothetical protein [Deltaproteobacteria bacterium]
MRAAFQYHLKRRPFMMKYFRPVYLQFGSDLPRYNPSDSWTLPLAARFIIDRKAVIRYAETDIDYRVRPEPEHTLKALEAIET